MQRIAQAVSALVRAERRHDEAQERQVRAREILHEIGDAYHPYDVQSGQAQSPEPLAARFAACWQRLSELAEQTDLAQGARERIAKAKRVTTQLLATLRCYIATVEAKVETLNLAPEIEALVHRRLIPGIYLERVAERSRDTETRRSLRRSCSRLYANTAPRSPVSTNRRCATSKSWSANVPIRSNAAVPAWKDATNSCPCIVTVDIASATAGSPR